MTHINFDLSGTLTIQRPFPETFRLPSKVSQKNINSKSLSRHCSQQMRNFIPFFRHFSPTTHEAKNRKNTNSHSFRQFWFLKVFNPLLILMPMSEFIQHKTPIYTHRHSFYDFQCCMLFTWFIQTLCVCKQMFYVWKFFCSLKYFFFQQKKFYFKENVGTLEFFGN